MKLNKLSIAAAIVTAGAFSLPQSAFADEHQAGQGWDAFQSRGGEMIVPQAYMGTSLNQLPGQGYDTFHVRDGAPAQASYEGTSTGPTGKGWDAFHAKDGDPI